MHFYLSIFDDTKFGTTGLMPIDYRDIGRKRED